VKRRTFIAGLGIAAALPVVSRAQQPAMPIIGFLSDRSPEATVDQVAAFRRGLAERGYVEGQNVAVKFQWAAGRYDRLPELAAELVRLNVNVLVAGGGTPTALAAQGATKSIPIVFIAGVDPVETGLVTSLSHPGGNLTGVSQLINETVAKRFEILRQVAPAATSIAVLTNPNNPVPASAELMEVQRAAQVLDVRVVILKAGTESEIDEAFATIAQQRYGALQVGVDAFFRTRRQQIVALAARYRVPTIYMFRESPAAGGLMSYGNDNIESARLVGIYTGRILKGDKPADLPVMQATKFQLVINLNTAKALGLTIPETLLATADEVIQ
jgi:putative tryptophan/tyrosine transport system substrate-binding protein